MHDLTVVLVVWGDYARYLDAALEPLAGLQVLVVDNFSNEPLAPVPPHRFVRTSERLTVGAARNFGVAQVDTEFVCLVDVDDVVVTDFLVAALIALRSSQLIAYAGTLVQIDEETLLPLGPIWPKKSRRGLTRFPRLLSTRCLFDNVVPVNNAVIRTSTFREAGGLGDTTLYEDWTLSALLPLYGRIKMGREVAALYRVRVESVSRKPRSIDERRRASAMVRSRWAATPARPWWAPLVLPLAQLHHERLARREAEQSG